MTDATFIALGTVATGLAVFSFCIFLAISARKKGFEKISAAELF